MHVTTSQISGKNHISSFQTKPSRAEKTWKSSILARGKSCVLPTDPFFTREIDYIQINVSKWQITILLTDDLQLQDKKAE